MSVETVCKECGAEYDMRHGECPACTIDLNIRSSENPKETFPGTGHLPFEMYGERFAVTQRLAAKAVDPQWLVTHVETGVAVPNSCAVTKEKARANGIEILTKVGKAQFHYSLAQIKKRFE